MVKVIYTTFPLLLFLLTGCGQVSTDPRPVFSDVQEDIAQRSGQRIYWKTYSQEDEAVNAKIQEMLKSNLRVDQAVQIALLNNPRIQGIYEQLGIAQAQLVQAGLLKNPVFEMSLKFIEGSGSDYNIEMGAAKDFLDVLFVGLRKTRAEAELEIVKMDVAREVLKLSEQTQKAFYSYLASAQTYRANEEIVKTAGLSYEAAKRLHDAGNITNLTLATEQTFYEQIKLELATSQTRMLQHRERLNTLMGLWGDQAAWETATMLPDLPDDTTDLTQLESRVIANSLDLTSARQRMEIVAAQMGIDAATLLFPEMTAGAEAEREGDGTWSAGPAFSIGMPIFDFGQARTAAGKARLRKLWNDYTATAIELRASCRSAKYRLVNARMQAIYYDKVMVPLSEQIMMETQLQYNAMQLGIFQLLEAKRMELRFRQDHITALKNYWIARTELELLLAGFFVRSSQGDLSLNGETRIPSDGH